MKVPVCLILIYIIISLSVQLVLGLVLMNITKIIIFSGLFVKEILEPMVVELGWLIHAVQIA